MKICSTTSYGTAYQTDCFRQSLKCLSACCALADFYCNTLLQADTEEHDDSMSGYSQYHHGSCDLADLGKKLFQNSISSLKAFLDERTRIQILSYPRMISYALLAVHTAIVSWQFDIHTCTYKLLRALSFQHHRMGLYKPS